MDNEKRVYEAGAVDYITKPFSVEALSRFAMLERWGILKEVYDDDRMFLNFSQQEDSLNGKPLF